ncbi:MAG: hypothetical protein K0R34_2338 [Herbinix sp.]|jgi:uncharacterized membrane protein|nr:hypothetical protein [Herbinix sp.]
MNEQDIWIKSMKYGEKLGCHQRPDRSFFIRGYQMPVCARCTGTMLGYLVAIPCFFLCGFSRLITVLGPLVMLVDWSLQALQITESTNRRRFVTGLIGGYGLMSIQLKLIEMVIKRLKKIEVKG